MLSLRWPPAARADRHWAKDTIPSVLRVNLARSPTSRTGPESTKGRFSRAGPAPWLRASGAGLQRRRNEGIVFRRLRTALLRRQALKRTVPPRLASSGQMRGVQPLTAKKPSDLARPSLRRRAGALPRSRPESLGKISDQLATPTMPTRCTHSMRTCEEPARSRHRGCRAGEASGPVANRRVHHSRSRFRGKRPRGPLPVG